MKIEIPDELAKEAGLDTDKELVIETTEIAQKIPEEVTGCKYHTGIVIYVKE